MQRFVTLHGPFANKRTVFRLVNSAMPQLKPIVSKRFVDIAHKDGCATMLVVEESYRKLVEDGLDAHIDTVCICGTCVVSFEESSQQ